MTILSDSPYMTIQYDFQTKIFEYHWKPDNIDPSDEGYQAELLNVMSFVRIYKPALIIADTQKSAFVVHLQMQEWLIENVIIAAAKEGMKKLAIIVSEDFITKLSVEQSIDDTVQKPFDTQYFDHLEKGRNWLKQFAQ